jgi:citrate lyase subunit alpha/citrate CoA-transferase
MEILSSLQELFQKIDIHKNPSISFHHHLRNGDLVINQVLSQYIEQNVKDIELFPSSIFPSYHTIKTLLERDQVKHITTNYMSGQVAEYLSNFGEQNILTMQTHGGRARAIIEGRSKIDIAFIAAPCVNLNGDAVGYKGPSKCGSLGYAIADSEYAKIVVLLTDHLIDEPLSNIEIEGKNIDYIIKLDTIGDSHGIVSGTTNITTNPIGVKIAKQTAKLLEEIGVIKNGFSFQSGAGGISLKVTSELHEYMKNNQINASFFSGGITGYHVRLLEEGMVDKLYDVQCFDLAAIDSLKKNANHISISASKYANPSDPEQVIQNLDVVILGATEIDLDFNVNVTTDSHGIIMGGSGGHSDTASEAKITVIVSPLLKGRLSIIKKRVTTITTLGKHVDILVTERGIAINPLRTDLIKKCQDSSLPIKTIEELYQEAIIFTGYPKELSRSDVQIGIIEDRTYEVIDKLYRK